MGDIAAQRPGPARLRFTLAISAGSFLLFLVQPMVARMALPRLGGAPAVWNSAMLVYQALLLGGYAYAHALGRAPPRAQAALHLALLALAALTLPIGLVAAEPSPTDNPAWWTPWFLAASIGPLFFAIAAQAPLLQRWYTLSGGGDPYPLYAASNLGSFAGLLAYPLVVEPFLPLRGQSALWSGGYGLLGVLVAACALRLPSEAPPVSVTPETRGSLSRWLQWVILAAVPSGLMLSTTTHLTTDIVAMPLLWVLPLGLYLFSFAIAFSDNRAPANAISHAAPLLILMGGGVTFAQHPQMPWLFAPLGLVLLGAVSVALHAALFRAKPEPSELTAFYLAMSLGGVLGGAFCALLAPLLFDWAYEHPMLILATGSLLVSPPVFDTGRRLWGPSSLQAALYGGAALLVSLIPAGFWPGLPAPVSVWWKLGSLIVLLVAAVLAIGSRIAYPLSLSALMLALGGWQVLAGTLEGDRRVRSYFGIYSLDETATTRTLVHGTTVHGVQSTVVGHTRDPLTYYAPTSGVGLVLTDLVARNPTGHAGLVGLGAGTLACYWRPGQDWRFYEIDPAVVAIARSRFTLLSDCAPELPIAVGDARLVLAREVQANATPLDVLVIDAFSSDAVPMHLLTQEAFDLYGRRLAPDGVLVMHVSNRFLDLQPVVAAARHWGWSAALRRDLPEADAVARQVSESTWIALSRDAASLTALRSRTGSERWTAVPERPGLVGWTDDHASILPVLKWRAP